MDRNAVQASTGCGRTLSDGAELGEVDGIMQRAVQRGLERREVQAPQRIGVDETSFQKRHEYVTVVNDLDGHVLHVADGRRQGVVR